MNDEPWRRDSGNVQGVGEAYSASAAAILASTSRSSASTRDDCSTRHESHQVGGLGFEAGDSRRRDPVDDSRRHGRAELSQRGSFRHRRFSSYAKEPGDPSL
jgi:hypothetical protein